MYDYCFKKSIDFGCCNGDDDDAHKDFFNFFMLKKRKPTTQILMCHQNTGKYNFIM